MKTPASSWIYGLVSVLGAGTLVMWGESPLSAATTASPPATSASRQTAAAEMEAISRTSSNRNEREEGLVRWQDAQRLAGQYGLVVGERRRHRRQVRFKVPTSCLFTKDNYSDFRLTLSSRMVASQNHAGVCFWGEIAEQGANKWYTHGPLVIFPNPSMWDYNAGKGLRVFRQLPTR